MKELERDYQRYIKLCEKSGENPKDENEIKYFWLEQLDDLLVKEGIHYNR